MSIKTTLRIDRATAIQMLTDEIPNLPNDALAMLMDALADSGQSKVCSKFDNFIVSEFPEKQ